MNKKNWNVSLNMRWLMKIKYFTWHRRVAKRTMGPLIFRDCTLWLEPGCCQNLLFIIIQRISKKWHANKPTMVRVHLPIYCKYLLIVRQQDNTKLSCNNISNLRCFGFWGLLRLKAVKFWYGKKKLAAKSWLFISKM